MDDLSTFTMRWAIPNDDEEFAGSEAGEMWVDDIVPQNLGSFVEHPLQGVHQKQVQFAQGDTDLASDRSIGTVQI